MGAEIKIDGGVLSKVKERGAPEGTQVEVRELFFLIPPSVRNFEVYTYGNGLYFGGANKIFAVLSSDPLYPYA